MSLPYEFRAESLIEDGRCSQIGLNQIKEWLLATSLPPLPNELIVLFLLSCENYVENAKQTILAYFKIKKAAPEIFNCRDIDSDSLRKASKTAVCVSLPVRMGGNTVIHYFKLRDTNYRNFDLVATMKLAYMLVDVSQRRNPPDDLVVLMDMEGLGLMHLTCLKIGAVKKFLEFLQEAMPLKIKNIHILNANYVFDKILAIARAFIKTELMSILKAHPPQMDMEEFFKNCIPASCLPKDYGGDLPTSEEIHEKSIEQFRELKQFFEAEEKLRTFYK